MFICQLVRLFGQGGSGGPETTFTSGRRIKVTGLAHNNGQAREGHCLEKYLPLLDMVWIISCVDEYCPYLSSIAWINEPC